MKRRYDITVEAERLEEGELVWLFNPKQKKGLSPKSMRPWKGPYVILSRINDLVYRIRSGLQRPIIVHRNRLYKYKERPVDLQFSTEADNSCTELLQLLHRNFQRHRDGKNRFA